MNKRKNMTPKISIITISYNSERTIEKTIKSIISQTYPNKEYIIIDGDSKDKTLEIINKYRELINIVISEKDKGISDAFNKGIHYAQGEIIGLINSDDYLCENALWNIYYNYEENIGVYRGKLINFNSITNSYTIEKPDMKFTLFPINIRVCHPSTFIRKDIYIKYGKYNVNFTWIMDLDLLIRLYRHKVEFKFIEEPLAGFSTNGITSSRYTKERYLEWKIMLKNNGASNISVCIFLILKKIKVFICNQFRKDFLNKIRDRKNIK